MKKIVKYCSVNAISMFKEVALNIINALELVREAISNALDAGAKKITIETSIDEELNQFCLTISDDGDGMDEEGLKIFFSLGGSTKIARLIGKKGLGTKIYFKSRRVKVITQKGSRCLEGVLDRPWEKLATGKQLDYTIEEVDQRIGGEGTTVQIIGYMINHPERVFSFEKLKDYVLWRTAAGSFLNKFSHIPELRKWINIGAVSPMITIDDKINNKKEEFVGEHIFSPPNENPEEVEMGLRSHDYCKHFGPFHLETYINNKYVSVQIYGTVSGHNRRSDIVHLGKGEGHRSRFGVVFCRDGIFVKNMKDTLLDDSNHNHYHIMVNSQNFTLTSDRNNISNLDSEEVQWILAEAGKLVRSQICKVAKDSYFKLIKDEEQMLATQNKIEELTKRFEEYHQKKNIENNGFPVVKEPDCESQVMAILIAMIGCGMMGEIRLGDYSDQSTTDVIIERNDGSLELMEVEYCLSRLFLHKHPLDSFDTVACWEIDLPDNYSKMLDGKLLTVKKSTDECYLQYGVNKRIKVTDLRKILTDFN